MTSTAVEDALIEAAIDNIKTTREHGYVLPDAEVGGYLASPAVLTSNAEDKAVIYDTLTGEPRQVLVNMLSKTLKKKRDGQPAFSTTPTKVYQHGQIPCWFNPASDRFAEMQSVPGLQGFTCASAHLASEFDAELHVQRRHDRRYARAKDYLDRQEKVADRKIQERQIEAMMQMAGKSATTAAMTAYYCEVDGCSRFFDSSQGRAMHVSRDHKE